VVCWGKWLQSLRGLSLVYWEL